MYQPGLEKHCTEVIFQLDNNLAITNIWPEKSETWGHETNALLQQPFTVLLSLHCRQPFEERIISFLSQKSDLPIQLEIQTTLPGNKESWFSLLVKKEGNAGQPIQCIIVATNIDQYKPVPQQPTENIAQLRELTSYLQKIREEERKYIAREIHDELGQMVTSLKMDISMCKKTVVAAIPELGEKITGIVDLTDKIVKTIRRIASELRPNILDDIGLVATMEWQSREFEKRSGLRCQFETNLEDDAALPADVCSNVFRIFQETLTNVMRHAQAKKVFASLIKNDNRLLLTITDDGKGFNTLEKQKTLGLLGMRERAIMLNGSFSINSILNKGTTTTVEITLQ